MKAKNVIEAGTGLAVVPKSTELSPAMLQKIHRDNSRMVSQGLALGARGRFTLAAGLWNIRETESYKAEGCKTLKEYIEKTGISESYFFNLLQTGDCIKAIAEKSGSDGQVINNKDVTEVFEISSANFKDFTVRGIFKASKSLESFEKYLTTGNVAEVGAETMKLLKPRKLTPEEIEELDSAGRVRAVQENDHMMYGHAYARDHGFCWNSDKKEWEHADGTPITEAEYAELTKYSDGLLVWEKSVELLANTAAELYKLIHLHGTSYKLFATKANDKFHSEVSDNKTVTARRLHCMEEMIAHLLEGDIDDALKAYKKSI